MCAKIRIQWCVDNSILNHEISLAGKSVLVSKIYLQNLLPPSYELLAVCALLEENATIELQHLTDTNGEMHFLLESSMSKSFSLILRPLSVCDSFESSKEDIMDKGEANISCVDVSSSSAEEIHEDIKEDEVTTNLKACTKYKSVVSYIIEYGQACILKKKLGKVSRHKMVEEIPRVYDGELVLEFPPTFDKIGNTHGMEQKYDGHLWTRPSTSNMRLECTVRISYCIGVLECRFPSCPFFTNNRRHNKCFFNGHLARKVAVGLLATDEKGKITCHFCRRSPYCIETCKCMVYYVMPHDKHMTRMMLHVGTHLHEVQAGTSQAMIEKTKHLVAKVVGVDRSAGPRKIQMNVAKEMIFSALVDDGTNDHGKAIGDVELTNFLEELVPLVENQRQVSNSVIVVLLFSICSSYLKFKIVMQI